MLKIQNKNDIAILEVSGDIMSNDYKFLKEDYDLTIPNDVKDFFKDNPNKDIRININSNGGDVFAGTAIVNMIREHKGTTTAYIQSIGASIASVIALSCDKVYMPKNSYLMIHKPFCRVVGNANELRATIELLDKIQSNIVDVYMTHSKVDSTVINELVDNETWLTGEEATKYFDVILTDSLNILNCVSDINYNNMPDFISNKEVEVPKLSIEMEERIKNLKIMEVKK